MEFTNTFQIPVEVDEAFEVLTDLERVAPCMPGAKLETVDGDTYTGRVKVKVGPMSLTYRGTAEVVEKDAEAHTARISARGNEARGGGTANADVSATLTAVEDGTEVVVTTNIDVTGKPAQFGRGVMADVGVKIIDAFSECLSSRLAGEEEAPEEEVAEEAPEEGAAAAPAGPRKVVSQEPETEALDLFDVAGGATAKRAVPLILVLLGIGIIIWLLRRKQDEEGGDE
jgi:carbon monoxide dehydrogenase subunit G